MGPTWDPYRIPVGDMANLNIHSLMNKWENCKANFMNKNLQVWGISETWLNANLPGA